MCFQIVQDQLCDEANPQNEKGDSMPRAWLGFVHALSMHMCSRCDYRGEGWNDACVSKDSDLSGSEIRAFGLNSMH